SCAFRAILLRMRSNVVLLALGLALVALTTSVVLTAHTVDPGAHHLHLLLYIGAAAPWALAFALLPRLARARGQLAILCAVAAATAPGVRWPGAGPRSPRSSSPATRTWMCSRSR